MDIEGAKALKLRLGHRHALSPRPHAPRRSENAPPVFQWLGVDPVSDQASPALGPTEPVARRGLFGRRRRRR
jgi:hypothetical protein